MRYLLAVDPGVKALGWAWFYFDKLVTCGLVRANGLDEMIVQKFPWNMSDLAIVERPVVYPRDGIKKAASLMSIALVAGAAAARSHAVEFVEPRTWKGSVPKEIHNARGINVLYKDEQDVLSALMNNEPMSLLHNVVDAVGIGLWKLGRM